MQSEPSVRHHFRRGATGPRHQLATVVHLVVAYIDATLFINRFDLVEDSPSTTNDGRAKRWVVVRPSGARTGFLLAQADGPRQTAAIGNQTGGRVGFFLRVDDFDATYDRMSVLGVTFMTEPRDEPYGRVVVFCDISGNKWDLLGAKPEGE